MTLDELLDALYKLPDDVGDYEVMIDAEDRGRFIIASVTTERWMVVLR